MKELLIQYAMVVSVDDSLEERNHKQIEDLVSRDFRRVTQEMERRGKVKAIRVVSSSTTPLTKIPEKSCEKTKQKSTTDG